MPIFDAEIDATRERHFFSLTQERWVSSNDLVESFKITLAQIFADDDSDLDEHRLKIKCEKFLYQVLDMFEKAEPPFPNDASDFVFLYKNEDESDANVRIN